MAPRILVLCILSTLCFSCVIARSLLPASETLLLDVSNSIQKTLDVISGEYEADSMPSQVEESTSSSPGLSFPVHSRLSLRRTEHEDYRSLTIARLERDAARVNWLQSILDMAIGGAPGQIPVISGSSQGSGEYFSRIGIGSPPTQVYMVLDTGSDVNWLQCTPCDQCYKQTDPIFKPSSSSSYSPLTCETQQCKSLDMMKCQNDRCFYEVSYGDGSYSFGEFATEKITLGRSASVNNVAIGCGHKNDGLFAGAAGLMGLGGGPVSFPSQINASSFSYCLVDRDSNSASTLEFDSMIPVNSVTAPLLRNPQVDTFYYVDMIGISVGGYALPIPESAFRIDSDGDGGVIIDSGTAVTRLPTEVYETFRDAFVRATSQLPPTSGESLFDMCYDLSSMTMVSIPRVMFHFSNGNSLPLPVKNILIPVDSYGTFCFAFIPTSDSMSIIGNVQQQRTRVTFDQANSRFGFTPNSC